MDSPVGLQDPALPLKMEQIVQMEYPEVLFLHLQVYLRIRPLFPIM